MAIMMSSKLGPIRAFAPFVKVGCLSILVSSCDRLLEFTLILTGGGDLSGESLPGKLSRLRSRGSSGDGTDGRRGLPFLSVVHNLFGA